jgi:hypothetical protein
MKYYDVGLREIKGIYPMITINDLVINVETMTCTGIHDEVTDAFRDFIRRYGIRVFVSNRPFTFKLDRKVV